MDSTSGMDPCSRCGTIEGNQRTYLGGICFCTPCYMREFNRLPEHETNPGGD